MYDNFLGRSCGRHINLHRPWEDSDRPPQLFFRKTARKQKERSTHTGRKREADTQVVKGTETDRQAEREGVGGWGTNRETDREGKGGQIGGREKEEDGKQTERHRGRAGIRQACGRGGGGGRQRGRQRERERGRQEEIREVQRVTDVEGGQRCGGGGGRQRGRERGWADKETERGADREASRERVGVQREKERERETEAG